MGREGSSTDFATHQQVEAETGGGAASTDHRPRPAKPPGREAHTKKALLIDNDGVILRGLSQTEELAPGWTDTQTQDIVKSQQTLRQPPTRDPVYPAL